MNRNRPGSAENGVSGGGVTRREFAKTLGLSWLGALAGCGAAGMPTLPVPPPGVIRPEAWGARGDGISDDGPAFIRMLNEITDGTTIWLTRGRTYLIGLQERMETRPESRILKLTGLRDIRITGGGCLKRAAYDPALPEATLLYLGGCTSPVVEDVWIDGNRPPGVSPDVNDSLVFHQCTGPRLYDYRATDSARHGVNFTGCSDIRWSRVVVERPRRYGVSHDASSGITGSDLVCTGSAERAAVEFTNGCSGWSVEHVEAIRCLLGGLLIGQHRAPGQSNLDGTVSHLTVRGGERGITIQGDTGVGNYNQNIRLRHVEVYDVTAAMMRVGNGRGVTLSDFRMISGTPGASNGILVTSDTSHLTLERGLIQGCRTPLEAVRVGEVTVRELEVRNCSGSLKFRGCDRVTAHDVQISGSSAPDYLLLLDGTPIEADTALADLQRITCQDNQVTAVRVEYGSGNALRRLVWAGNRGLTLDVHRPNGVDPIREYVGDF